MSMYSLGAKGPSSQSLEAKEIAKDGLEDARCRLLHAPEREALLKPNHSHRLHVDVQRAHHRGDFLAEEAVQRQLHVDDLVRAPEGGEGAGRRAPLHVALVAGERELCAVLGGLVHRDSKLPKVLQELAQ